MMEGEAGRGHTSVDRELILDEDREWITTLCPFFVA